MRLYCFLFKMLFFVVRYHTCYTIMNKFVRGISLAIYEGDYAPCRPNHLKVPTSAEAISSERSAANHDDVMLLMTSSITRRGNQRANARQLASAIGRQYRHCRPHLPIEHEARRQANAINNRLSAYTT